MAIHKEIVTEVFDTVDKIGRGAMDSLRDDGQLALK